MLETDQDLLLNSLFRIGKKITKICVGNRPRFMVKFTISRANGNVKFCWKNGYSRLVPISDHLSKLCAVGVVAPKNYVCHVSLG